VVGFLFLNLTNWFGIFLMFLRISKNFLRHWTELQENLDSDLHNQALDFTRSTLELLQSKQFGPWPGRVARARLAPASWRRRRPGKRPGSTTCSPRSCRLPWLGHRGGRRRGSAATGGGGRGGSGKGGEMAQCWATSERESFTRI
jgi:hypothetical protein